MIDVMSIFNRNKIVDWEPGYYPDITTANSDQKQTYEYVKKAIKKGQYVECSDAYLYAYSYEINANIVRNITLDLSAWYELYKEYSKFVDLYEFKKPKVVSYLYPWAILGLVLTKKDIRDYLEQYMEFYMRNNLSGDSEFITSLYMTSHQIYSSSRKVEGRLFRAFVGEDLRQDLTQTGKKFYTEVMQVVDVLLQGDYEKHGINYLYRLYDFEDGVIHISLGEYANFIVTSKKDIPPETQGYKLQIQFPKYNTTKKSAYIKSILREAENLVRLNKGLQKIGEGWVSETLLFRQVQSGFKNTKVVQHASPAFLGKQHYDVYLPEHRIALEYQGEQHSRPVAFFGGEEAFIKSQERDSRKKDKSIANGIYQIDVFPGYDLNEVIKEVASRIYSENSGDFEQNISTAISDAESASVTIKDLSASHTDAIDRIASSTDVAEVEDFRYELAYKKLLNAKKKDLTVKEIDYVNIPREIFEGYLEKLNEVKQVSKIDPQKSNDLAFALIKSGYTAPAIYERIAINYRKLGLLNEELNFLLQAKKDLDYNFDARIKQILKKTHQ